MHNFNSSNALLNYKSFISRKNQYRMLWKTYIIKFGIYKSVFFPKIMSLYRIEYWSVTSLNFAIRFWNVRIWREHAITYISVNFKAVASCRSGDIGPFSLKSPHTFLLLHWIQSCQHQIKGNVWGCFLHQIPCSSQMFFTLSLWNRPFSSWASAFKNISGHEKRHFQVKSHAILKLPKNASRSCLHN